MKTQKKISTNRSQRTFRNKFEKDNDGDIIAPPVDTVPKGTTLGENPEEEEAELTAQALEEKLKQQKIRDKEIEEAIINSTQRQADAINKTIQEIMYGPLPEKKEGKN